MTKLIRAALLLAALTLAACSPWPVVCVTGDGFPYCQSIEPRD